MDDATLSNLLEEIEIKQQPIVIGFDIFRDVPVPPGYGQLQTTLLNHPQHYWYLYDSVKQNKWGQPPPQLLRGTQRVGFNDIVHRS